MVVIMKELFALSYAILWGVIVLEALVLHYILQETLRFKRLITESEVTPAPHFTAPVLGTDKFLGKADLRGDLNILLFVSPDGVSQLYEKLHIAIHALWHKANGHLYIVCNGSEESCRQLTGDYRVEGFRDDQVPVILDEGGRISASFLIDSTPQAVKINKDGRIVSRGHPLPNEEAADDGIDSSQRQSEDISNESTTIGLHLVEKQPEETSIAEPQHIVGSRDEEPCHWPDDRLYSGAAFARMDTTISCLLTRFQLRSVWSLIPFYLAFRRVRRSAKDVSGLLKAVFLIENLRTCYTMSFWKNDCAIVDFSRVNAHIKAANSAFGPTYRKDLKRPEIWSAQFRLWAVSCHNLNWEGLDLQTLLGDQWGRREVFAQAGFPKEEYGVDR
jgi:hypothetical protein